MKNTILTQTTPAGFGSVCSAFIIDSLQHMIPWLIVTCVVILTDLFFGIRKSILMGEEVRYSRAARATMGKMVTYFAWVCMVVMINVASGLDLHIDVYACLLVCFIEFCSILSNILKPKGFKVDIIKAIGIFTSKAIKVDKNDISDVITKEK